MVHCQEGWPRIDQSCSFPPPVCPLLWSPCCQRRSIHSVHVRVREPLTQFSCWCRQAQPWWGRACWGTNSQMCDLFQDWCRCLKSSTVWSALSFLWMSLARATGVFVVEFICKRVTTVLHGRSLNSLNYQKLSPPPIFSSHISASSHLLPIENTPRAHTAGGMLNLPPHPLHHIRHSHTCFSSSFNLKKKILLFSFSHSTVVFKFPCSQAEARQPFALARLLVCSVAISNGLISWWVQQVC